MIFDGSREGGSGLARCAFIFSVVAMLLWATLSIPAAATIARSTRLSATVSIARISERDVSRHEIWSISFAGRKPLHRVTRIGQTVQLSFAKSSCPPPASITVAPLASRYAESAAYVSCNSRAQDAILTFRVATSEQVRIIPGNMQLTITVSPARPRLFARRTPVRGTSLTRAYFGMRATSYVASVLQKDERKNLNLVIDARSRNGGRR